ncbi:MAG: hypothetical protein EKK42_18130 [Pseudonocardiaceae bacterium]|nr:MAG: hypothetical protein EKK42_18130 [Pseudonocardiaceae bacterium]
MELYERLLALDHSREPPWGPLHAVVVAAYTLQHNDSPVRENDPRLALLRAFVGGGVPALARLTSAHRRANSHRSSGPRDEDATPLTRPASYAVTIADVAVDGEFPAEGHEERMRAWAAAVLDAWTS